MASSRRITIVVVLELTIIVFILVSVLHKYQLYRHINVMPINKSDILFPKSTSFKFFYELPASVIQYPSNAWVKKGTGYLLNKDGLNERYDYSATKSADIYRIITLGDSNTFGVYLNTKDNYPEQLEDLLNHYSPCRNYKKFEVINLGVFGYDIPYEVEHFKRKGVKYNADLLIWMIKNNDFFTSNELIIPLKDKLHSQNSLPIPGTVESNNYEAHMKADAVTQSLNTYGKDKIKDYVQKSLFSMNDMFHKDILMTTFFKVDTEYAQILTKFTKQRPNTFWYDSQTNIYGNKDLTFLPDDSHANKKGYTVIAHEILDYLKTKKIISCE